MLSFLMACSTIAATRRRTHGWLPSDGLMLAILFCLGIFVFATGTKSDTYFLPLRLETYMFLILLLWLGLQNYDRRFRILIQKIAVALSLTLLVIRIAQHQTFENDLNEYCSAAPFIAENSTILPINFAPLGSCAVIGAQSANRISPACR